MPRAEPKRTQVARTRPVERELTQAEKNAQFVAHAQNIMNSTSQPPRKSRERRSVIVKRKL